MPNPSTQKLLFHVLLAIQPGKDEIKAEHEFSTEVVGMLQKKFGRRAQVMVAGSMAKGTFLKNDKDLDIFVLFPEKIKKSEFLGIIKTAACRSFPEAKYETRYAEHPYLRLSLSGRRIDIVPAYGIKRTENLKSAVDRSVFHTVFVRKNLEKKKIADVLLLKKFFKSNELYGAEIKVGGFSGYLCELMIINYGGFIKFLKSAKEWTKKSQILIDMEKNYKTKNEKINVGKKFNSRLIVIDPTDKNRNVAAAVSEESFVKLAKIAGRFLKKPSEKYFAGAKSLDDKIRELKKKNSTVYLIDLKHDNVVDDIVWGQARKLSKQLSGYLEKNEFAFSGIHMNGDSGIIKIIIPIKKEKLSGKRKIIGPMLKLSKNVLAFRKAHHNAKFKKEKNRIIAFIPRKISDAKQAITEFFKRNAVPSHLSLNKIKKL